MLHRIVRPVLAILFILTGIASAGVLWFSGQQIASAHGAAALADARVDALLGELSERRSALQAYVAPGQSVTTWAQRSAALHAQLTTDLAALEALPEAGPVVQVVRPALTSLAKIDGRAREYLRSGDELMAADLAFNEARDTTTAAAAALTDWRAVRQATAAGSVSELRLQQNLAIGVGVLAWALSLILVWRRPANAATTEVVIASPVEFPMSEGAGAAPVQASPSRGALDLSAAAQACAALAVAGDAPQLKAALGDVAAAVGAKGLVVWLGVGDELFAVASQGYDERHLRKPIARGAENVTAEAWRTGAAVTVPGADEAPGVVVVPMVAAAGCRGVVSVELVAGRSASAECQALLSIFASQLAGIVGAATPTAEVPLAPPTSAAVEQAS